MNALEQDKRLDSRAVVAIPDDTAKPARKYNHSIGRLRAFLVTLAVAHHAMLAAVSLGLGTTIIGLVPPVVDRSKLLRKRYGIPKENKVCTSLILGYAKYKYKKSIRRDLAGVRMM